MAEPRKPHKPAKPRFRRWEVQRAISALARLMLADELGLDDGALAVERAYLKQFLIELEFLDTEVFHGDETPE